MNVRMAALNMVEPVKNSTLPDNHPEYGKDHMLEMINKIDGGSMSRGKANRWLGYIQGCVVSHGGASLDKIKSLNKNES